MAFRSCTPLREQGWAFAFLYLPLIGWSHGGDMTLGMVAFFSAKGFKEMHQRPELQHLGMSPS